MPRTRKPPTGRGPQPASRNPRAQSKSAITAAAGVAAAGVVHRYVRAIGMPPTDAVTLHAVVKEGVPFSAVRELQVSFELSQAEIRRLVQMPESTFARRRAQGRLDAGESDRLLRVARIFDLARTTFDGDVTEARAWLSRPQRVLGGAKPEELATTEIGAQEVERALLRIEHGVFA